jgi:hypothetical protein
MKTEPHRWLAGGLLIACLPSTALAQPPGAISEKPAGFVAGARSFFRSLGAGVEFDGRYRFESEVELGLRLQGAYLDEGYLSGHTVSPVATGGAGLVVLFPVTSSGPLDLFARYVPGLAFLEGVEDDASAVRQTNEFGAFGHVMIGTHGLLRVGAILGVDLEIDPTTDLADQSQAITLGYGHAFGESWLLYADVTSGGTFGFNGDNGKAILEGSIGVRIPVSGGGARGAF